MKRRDFIFIGGAAAIALFGAPAIGARPRKIGWLKIQDSNHTPGQLREFIDGLRALGLEENTDFVMEYRFANGDASRLSDLANELIRAGARQSLAPPVERGHRARSTELRKNVHRFYFGSKVPQMTMRPVLLSRS
jgi:hypothetical protein